MPLSKVITVIPTFFYEDYTINYNALGTHINNQLSSDIKDIVILGTTSETPTLTSIERMEIIKFVHNKFRNSINNLIIGLAGNDSFSMAIEMEQITPYADYIMISQPSYNKPTQEGIYRHYKYLIENTHKNIIIYNIPSRCGVNIEPSTIKRICEVSDRVVAIKEASGSMDQIMQVRLLCPELLVYSGDDALTLPVLSIGGYGVISVISNLIPNLIQEMVYDYTNINKSQKIFYNILPLIKLCFIESNPTPIKFMLSQLNNQNLNTVRLPLVELTEESKKKIIYQLNINNDNLIIQ